MTPPLDSGYRAPVSTAEKLQISLQFSKVHMRDTVGLNNTVKFMIYESMQQL